jgi:hypothetical protein
MGHYLDGEDGKVYVKMYAGRAMGISFPTDGNNHYEPWIKAYDDGRITINKHPDGELISIEINLPPDIVSMETNVDPTITEIPSEIRWARWECSNCRRNQNQCKYPYGNKCCEKCNHDS